MVSDEAVERRRRLRESELTLEERKSGSRAGELTEEAIVEELAAECAGEPLKYGTTCYP